MPKPLSHSSYILKIEKLWEYWSNYSDDLLIKLIEKCDTLGYPPFFKYYFLQTSLHVFYCLRLFEAKAAVQKNRAVF